MKNIWLCFFILTSFSVAKTSQNVNLISWSSTGSKVKKPIMIKQNILQDFDFDFYSDKSTKTAILDYTFDLEPLKIKTILHTNYNTQTKNIGLTNNLDISTKISQNIALGAVIKQKNDIDSYDVNPYIRFKIQKNINIGFVYQNNYDNKSVGTNFVITY